MLNKMKKLVIILSIFIILFSIFSPNISTTNHKYMIKESGWLNGYYGCEYYIEKDNVYKLYDKDSLLIKEIPGKDIIIINN